MACTSDSGAPRRALRVVLAALAALLLCAPGTASAQRRGTRDAQVRALVRTAVTAYQNVEVDDALARLETALRTCREPSSCSPSVRASVHATMGVIQLNGRNDAAAAQQAFVLALQADPSVEIDRMIATPETSAALVRARRAMGVSSTPQLLHTPVAEQLANTPVPLFVQGGPDGSTRVDVAYRLAGSDAWTELNMPRVGQGFGVEIPCAAVRTPALEYYITGYNDQGRVVGEAGSEAVPLRVEVVIRRTRGAAFIPGRLPPETCGASGGPGGRQLGEACTRNTECASGLQCETGVCTQPLNRPAPPDPERTWVAFNLGGGIGLGFLDTLGYSAAYDEALAPPGNPMGPASCDLPLSCPVPATGVGVTPHIDLNARVHIIRRFAVGAGVRWQPDRQGRTTLAPVLISLRGYFALTNAGFARRGLLVAVFLGTGVGQIQPAASAPSMERMGAPTGHVITGLNNIQGGALLEYAFHSVFHAGGELAMHVMFPRVLFDIDLQAYIGVHF